MKQKQSEHYQPSTQLLINKIETQYVTVKQNHVHEEHKSFNFYKKRFHVDAEILAFECFGYSFNLSRARYVLINNFKA